MHAGIHEQRCMPGNPLASPSRAVVDLFASSTGIPAAPEDPERDHDWSAWSFDGNDVDTIRLLENPFSSRETIEREYRGFRQSKNPVFLDGFNAREMLASAWMDGNKQIDPARDASAATAIKSRDVVSIRPGNKGLVSSIFDGFHAGTVPVSGSTDGAYEACIADSLSDSLDLFINWNIDRIPACISKFDLEKLDLDWNRISRIEGIDKNVNLKELGLNGNRVSRIEGLDKLVNLKELGLNGNRVSRIEGLDKLVNLEGLYLNSNPLEPGECEKAKKIVEKRKRGGTVSC